MSDNEKSSHLPDTFFNKLLLKENPFALRDELFGSQRDPKDVWGLVDSLLCGIEREANKVLFDQNNPPPFYAEEQFSDELTEDQFWNLFGLHQKAFTDKQANAIGALRSIGILRRRSDPPEPGEVYDATTVGKIIMETVLLVMAAFRGDFWTDIWPDAEKNIIRENRLRENSTSANQKRWELNGQLRDWSQQLAKQKCVGRRNITCSARFILEEMHRAKALTKFPAHKTVMSWIRPVFPRAHKKKPR